MIASSDWRAKSYPQPVDVACKGAVIVLLWRSVSDEPLERIPHLAIAGNIGSGKTTLTTLLAKHYRYTPHFEQVDDNPYLNDFYKDMTRWSFNLQIYLKSRFAQLIEMKKKGKPIIQDRTIYEDAHIFAPNLQAMGPDH